MRSKRKQKMMPLLTKMKNNFDLVNIVKQTTINVKAMSESLTIMAQQVDGTNKRIDKLIIFIRDTRESVEQVNDKINGFIEDQKRKEEEQEKNRPINGDEKQILENAMNSRVRKLLVGAGLSGHRFKRYYGGFRSLLWNNSKRHSYVRGTAGEDTKKCHLDEVLSYVNNWYPYVGVDRYIEYLDECRENLDVNV